MSPRCKKPRFCNHSFKVKAFHPAGVPITKLKRITLFRDELEALRLCDLKELTQEEAGRKMGVSRGTVQRILSSGRKKVAQAFAECKALVLEKTL